MKEKWLDIRLDNFESYGEPTLPIKFMDAKLTGSTNLVKRCFTTGLNQVMKDLNMSFSLFC